MRLWPLLAIAAVAAAPAHADLTATYVAVNGTLDFKMKVEVAANGDLRTDMFVAGPYMIKREGRVYFVAPNPAAPVVQDVEDVGAVMQEELGRMNRHFCDDLQRAPAFPSMVSRGTVTIAGRAGEAYGHDRHAGSRPEVVISRDPALAPLGAAMAAQFRLSMTMMGPCASKVPMFAQMQALLDSGAPLQFGPMRLDTVETGPIDPARFVLPAAPETREQVRARMVGKSRPTVTIHPRPGQ